MANITVDLTEKACRYVESLYSVRNDLVEDCERVLAVCKPLMDDVNVAATAEEVKKIYSFACDDLRAIDDALRSIHLAIYDGNVYSDGWPSNINRIRRFINEYEGTPCEASEVFRAVLSAFGIVYSYEREAGIIIRYISRPQE